MSLLSLRHLRLGLLKLLWRKLRDEIRNEEIQDIALRIINKVILLYEKSFFEFTNVKFYRCKKQHCANEVATPLVNKENLKLVDFKKDFLQVIKK